MNESSINVLVDLARNYYNSNTYACYHTWKHAIKVHTEAVLLMSCELPNTFDYSIPLAAHWHDAIYIPMANINETASAAALYNAWHYANIQDDTVILTEAIKLIERTTVKHHLSSDSNNLALDILLDADLSSLADPYEVFIINQDNIIKENNATPNRESRRKAAKFLSLIYDKPTIYRTNTGKQWYEQKARSNISTFINYYQ